MSKKKSALLNEATTRRFWQLANIHAINEMGYDFGRDDEEESLEEQEEEMGMEEEDPMPAEDVPMDVEPELDAPEEAGAEVEAGGDVEAEVSIPESDVAALETAREVID